MDNYAGFWIRAGAYLIDAILLGIVGAILGAVLLGGMADPAGDGSMLINLISIVIGVAYFAGMESSSHQATLGKKAFGLVVTDDAGNRISLGRAIGRYFAKILSALVLLIGFIMVAFTDRKQGLHDMLAGTLVFKGDPATVGTNPDVFS